MQIGWLGLGKLGLPCALALSQHHDVYGYDVTDWAQRVLKGELPPPQEEGIAGLLAYHGLTVQPTVAAVVEAADIVFVAVQTPHAPAFGGEKPLEGPPQDFEYAYLTQACRDVCREAQRQRRHITLVVVSTVLPGTTHRFIEPLLNQYVDLVYSPQFIAMGTTIADFRDPEFVICGTTSAAAARGLAAVFTPVHGDDRLHVCDIDTAEAIKIFYNTFISMKIVFANMVMEVCHKTGADCDGVIDGLSKATDRVISPAYLRGGMGDGGACHPRDAIALSWLAGRLDLSYDLMGEIARAREQQTRWLADMALDYSHQTGRPIVIMGEAYKPGSDLTYGSPARLLRHYLAGAKPSVHDPHTGASAYCPQRPGRGGHRDPPPGVRGARVHARVSGAGPVRLHPRPAGGHCGEDRPQDVIHDCVMIRDELDMFQLRLRRDGRLRRAARRGRKPRHASRGPEAAALHGEPGTVQAVG